MCVFVVLSACVVCVRINVHLKEAVYTVQPQKGQHKNAVGWWSHLGMYFGVGIEVHIDQTADLVQSVRQTQHIFLLNMVIVML